MDINGEPSSSSSSGFKLFGKTIVLASEKDGQDQDDDSSITIADQEEESLENNTTKARTTTTTTSGTKMGPGHLLACPRCKSKETKFCYFNNYNVNQPRHFCKACHRYWTAGGALRNVPVGAGRRKNRALPQDSSSRSGSGDEGGGMCLVAGGGEEEGERWLVS